MMGMMMMLAITRRKEKRAKTMWMTPKVRLILLIPALLLKRVQQRYDMEIAVRMNNISYIRF
jgi:hypothetical protein